ncbi:hypothetical protein [Rheinheimera maricola]|uniref:Tetratricopeptide repeat protein n=1 Tax=Rheinheimera maricola TaxID=2793282 RepID=A0ABS7X9F7_9GAMM|nr:hypothetical protein [Rheinheimera maricola]MBZ9611730.1 hypothetical protein [Rheinheimera maricola]
MKRLFLVAFGFLSAFQALAFNFSLSESEFNTWDERCKIAFSVSGAGKKSGFYQNMAPRQNADMKRFGEEAGGAWHYCAGLILLHRANSTSGKEREENLIRAAKEINFTVARIPQNHEWYPEIYVDYARAQYLNNNKIEAFTTLKRLTTTHPTHSLAYTALAYYLKKENQLEQAIAALQQAPELLLNESAELNYFLGWYLMEANRAEAAVVYAKRAYELDYPVPTLRQRLATKGLSW